MAKFKFKWESTPIINLFAGNKSSQSEFECVQNLIAQIYLLRNKNKNESCIDFHKSKLGKQITTWTGSSENRKFYIWEGENWRIFVHNIAGITFEVKENISKEKAIEALQEYLKKIA